METRETRLVRLKAMDRRRGHVLRRFTYQGLTCVAGAGWYRVGVPIADHLREVRQLDGDPMSPLAFDVCTDAEARLLDEAEARDASAVRRATDDLPTHTGRGTVTTAELPEAPAPGAEERGRRTRKDRE